MYAKAFIAGLFVSATLLAAPQAGAVSTMRVDIANQTTERVHVRDVRYLGERCKDNAQCNGEVRDFANKRIDPGRNRKFSHTNKNFGQQSKVQVEVSYSCVGKPKRLVATSDWMRPNNIRATIRNCDGDVSFSR